MHVDLFTQNTNPRKQTSQVKKNQEYKLKSGLEKQKHRKVGHQRSPCFVQDACDHHQFSNTITIRGIFKDFFSFFYEEYPQGVPSSGLKALFKKCCLWLSAPVCSIIDMTWISLEQIPLVIGYYSELMDLSLNTFIKIHLKIPLSL